MSFRIRLSSLFRIISRVCEDSRINPSLDPIITCDDDAIYGSMNEVIVQHILPDCLHELTAAVSHELVALGLPVWVPACNPTFERVWKLQKILIRCRDRAQVTVTA